MALDLEEQEQVEELKAWWKQHGRLITAVVLAAALGFAGWQLWRWYQSSQAAQASSGPTPAGSPSVRARG